MLLPRLFAAIVVGIVLPFACIALAEDEFQATVVSHTSAVFTGVGQWDAAEIAISARNVDHPGGTSPMVFEGAASNLKILRFQQNWTEARASPNDEYGFLVRDPGPTVSEGNAEHVKFEYDADSPFAAAVLRAGRAAIESKDRALELRSVARSPVLAGDSTYENHGATFGPEEKGYWRIQGNYATFRHEGVEGITSGRLDFYFALGHVDLQVGNERTRLESRIWDDEAPGSLVRVRHLVWYRLQSDDASSMFSIGPPSQTLNSVGFAQLMRLPELKSLSLESYSNVSGSLPKMSNQTGPSAWIGGPIDVMVEADQRGTEQAFGSYKLTASGNPSAYSIGGGNAISLSSASILAAPAIPILLALLLFGKSLFHVVKEPIFLLYSKFSGPDLLLNAKREALFRIIRESPGMNFTSLREVFKRQEGAAGASSVLYHLWYLEREELIKSHRKGKYRRYYESEGKGADFALLSMLKNPPRPELAKLVVARPGINQSELRAEMQNHGSFKAPILRHHLKKLVEEKLLLSVRSEVDARKTQYFPTEKLTRMMPFLQEPANTFVSKPDLTDGAVPST